MQKVKLSNILLESGPKMDFHPDLYARSASPIIPDKDSSFAAQLMPYAKYDFGTYFNTCSCAKYKKYTYAENFFLHLELKGSGEVRFETVSRTSLSTVRTMVGRVEFENEEFDVIEFEFPETSDILLAFEIVTYGTCHIKNSYYFTHVADEEVSPVRLSVAMTTFNNEKFVIPNIQLFKRELLSLGDEIARSLTVHVVDNGRSLDVEGLSGGGVFIHPNPNVGGSGGFARGMIESIHQKVKPTHVLLMDDDVSVSPESIRRTYALLSIRREAYIDAFVSGAMLKLEKPNMQFEDVAYVREDALYDRIKPDLDMEDISDVVLNETIDVEKRNAYCAWWYCCIPMSVIEENGLPLPLFVRCDDVEYGMRCQPTIMAMGGICVWHSAFGGRFKASIDLYQYTRNFMIATALVDPALQNIFIKRFWDNIQLELKKFNYDSADLLLDAFEDYLRGPKFIEEVSGEDTVKRNSTKNEKLIPLSKIGFPGVSDAAISLGEIAEDGGRTILERLVDYATFNGHRLPNVMLKDGFAVVPAGGFSYPAKRMRMHRVLLAVDSDGKLGSLRTMDRTRFRQIMKRYKRCLGAYRSKRDAVIAEYAAAAKHLRSEGFWKRYLGM